ncbi:hypothetical protein [Leptospira borgpetersenii]|uniref:hypothetical protein n=1 Tax=Leptospira borgpetersenii TaxID=174 RepID=UPI0007732190|nr:hypothetical protein [Leptospira borgpetersenii]MBE8401330.1 hypothetical protein [Leptospira borgpetersenii serovar Tarassovi]MBE8404331.1 hypothetical protein [Leptospira borgpetersenii serovar Tarassovi]MBE8407459.1 hypothetical protein [Leptospira borgpetersenii serovar Tarassovi]MBE8413776.1 hypothetical protein [Leptospira borgpetersenii serovar Tarassovi]MBE8417070.1 hypothetical protein [Leptospira borgpetersenii serovar Tarassovi]
MKRLISISLILSFVSCASYSERVRENKTDLDRMEQIVFASHDIPKEDLEFIRNTLNETKELLDTGVSESALADKWRGWVFDKWLFVSLFVLGMIGLIILKINSFSWTSLIPSFSIPKNGGQENAG